MVIRRQFSSHRQWQPGWRIENAPLAFLDLETTGLHPERGQRIIEIALLDAGGVRIHRQVDTDTAKPRFSESEERAFLREVCEVLEDVIVVGHNILFDLRFIAERARRLQGPLPTTGFIDTLRLARRFADEDDCLKLSSVAEKLGLEIPDDLHCAIPDARLARSVFETLIERHELEILADVDVQRLSLYER